MSPTLMDYHRSMFGHLRRVQFVWIRSTPLLCEFQPLVLCYRRQTLKHFPVEALIVVICSV